ncbi:MAG: FkbM family methyltransferase [Hyphomicrobiales bacterium]|nr:FkbM family methyltransferase [Hyphomicrobiales bacterium]
MNHYIARISMSLAVPAAMHWAIKDVLEGEYEAGYDGVGLDILDVGANVGSFALWATARWPGSVVTSYEPHPGTFAFLKQNTAQRRDIIAVNAALFPGGQMTATFMSRFAGDGESGLAAYMGDTFVAGAQPDSYEVSVVDPASLPSPDIVKIDIEGGEGDVLDHIDLSRTSLVLLEYQNRKNKAQLEARLRADFELIDTVEHAWDPLLEQGCYRPDLAGDVYGRMFAVRKGVTRMVRRADMTG